MNNLNLTKEQISLYTVIGCAVLLIIWFFIPSGKVSFLGLSESFNMVNMVSGAGFLLTCGTLLAFLCPIYIILYTYRDKPALKSLKPIFVIDSKISGIVLVAAAILVIIGLLAHELAGPAFGAWLYLIIAGGICYLGILPKK